MKKRCRFCLSSNAEEFFSVHEEYKTGLTLAEFVHQLADVDIEYDDGLPQDICGACYFEVRRLLEFGLGVRRADEELRMELNLNKCTKESDSDQMGGLEIVENDFFAEVDTEVCVVEEVLELEADNQDGIVVEEIHDGEEIHLVEEILTIDKDTEQSEHTQKEDLLVELAHVAATQENVKFVETLGTNTASFYNDENDDNYLIEFDPNEMANQNLKPLKWKCGECKLILRGDVSYEGHMNMHKQLRPHKCTQCSYAFRCRSALRKHQESKHKSEDTRQLNESQQAIETSYLCVECKKHFNTDLTFYIHEVMVHNKYDTVSSCPFCSNRKVENLKDHLQSHHMSDSNTNTEDPLSTNEYDAVASTVWQCYVCSKTYRSLELLNDHHKLCHKADGQEPEDLKIEYLDDVTSTTNANEEQLFNGVSLNAKDSVESSVQCDICKRKLLRKNISKHMELHNRKDKEAQDESRKYLCTACHDTHDEELCEHITFIHISPVSFQHLYECSECYESFSELKHLQEHKKNNHSKERKIKSKFENRLIDTKCECVLCGNRFRNYSQLSAHKRLHKERPFKCDRCDKAYPRKVELQIHMRTHTGELPYACHLCDKRFAIKVRLTYHLQKHEGITHPCPYCTAVYDNRNKLKAHLFKHTGMPYICELCPGLGFDRRLRFANHMQKIHQKTLTEEELGKIFAKNTGKTVHFINPKIRSVA